MEAWKKKQNEWKLVKLPVPPEDLPSSHFRLHRPNRIASCWKEMAWRGNLSKNIKELRLLMCQSSPASASARAFVEKNYKELKTLNPKLPILIRECSGVEPQLWARYDLGVERGIKLEGMTEPQILKALEDLVKAGQSLKA
ncbi:unnamed protein product [Vicia faba]|uniref:Ribosomal protein/NADH dehydrogenase domain-containing protein n=1 Tax=Vicia faba TaxID=3906 RepID=A0AAV0YWB1_VICFA|nr:unnamed protein product [Vicia faba]